MKKQVPPGIAVPAVSVTASALHADDSILQPFSWDSGAGTVDRCTWLADSFSL